MTGKRHWQKMEIAALDVPTKDPVEVASWRARNACELLLYCEVTQEAPDAVDEIVQSIDLTLADPRICARLFNLRSLFPGSLAGYEYQRRYDSAGSQLPHQYRDCAQQLIDFSSHLLTSTKKMPLQEQSLSNGAGGRAVRRRSNWRPSHFVGANSLFVDNHQIPAELIRRSWMFVPNHGAVMLVPKQLMDVAKLDIWWGVHNGIHLDSIAFFQEESPSKVEFGRGLLTSEGLAVCAEILAAAEYLTGLDNGDPITIGAGLIERATRLTIQNLVVGPDHYPFIDDRNEFLFLPTIASAYVVEPLRLIANNFESEYIPNHTAKEFISRFSIVKNQNRLVSDFLDGINLIFRS